MAKKSFYRPSGRNNGQGQLIEEFFIEEEFRGTYSGTNLIYAGFAKPGASEDAPLWQISKMAYDGSGNLLSVKWPVDDRGICSNDYEFVWTTAVANGYTFI